MLFPATTIPHLEGDSTFNDFAFPTVVLAISHIPFQWATWSSHHNPYSHLPTPGAEMD